MWITLRVTGQTECAVEVTFSWYDLFCAIFTVTSIAIRTHNSSLSSVTHQPVASPHSLSLSHTHTHTQQHTLQPTHLCTVVAMRALQFHHLARLWAPLNPAKWGAAHRSLSLAIIHPSPSVNSFLPLIFFSFLPQPPSSSSTSFSNRMFSVQTQLDIISDKLRFSVQLSVHWLFQAWFRGVNEHASMIITKKCSDTIIKRTQWALVQPEFWKCWDVFLKFE